MKLSRCTAYLSLSILLAALFHPLTAQYTDCGIAWDATRRLSSDSIPSNFPQLAVTGDTIHVIWLGQDFLGSGNAGGIQYSHSYDGGTSFSSQKALSAFDTANTPAFIACSGANVYIGFFADIDTFHGAAMLRSTDAGMSWLPPQRLLRSGFPLILKAPGSDVILYCQLSDKYSVLVSTDFGATWSVNSTNAPPLNAIVATPGKLHGVLTTSSPPKDVYYYYSMNLGRNWSFGEVLSREDFINSDFPRLAWNGENELYAVWRDRTDSGSTIMMRRSRNAGLSWLPEVYISEQQDITLADIAAGQEFTTVVWDENVSGAGGIKVRSSNDFGFSFCPIDSPVTNSSTGESQIQISGTRVCLAWSEMIDGSSEIIFRGGTLTRNPRIGAVPSQFALHQNYPNPFNGFTHISFDLPVRSYVTLAVYDLLGQRVAKLVDDELKAGRYDAEFSAANIATGVYFYRLQSSTSVETKKLLITR